jgi:hypothetical protein
MAQKKIDDPVRTKKSNLNLKLITIVFSIIILAVVVIFITNKFSMKSNLISQQYSADQINEIEKDDFVKEGELTFINSDSDFITSIEIEIAENNNERTQGLMFRKNINENQGMLFIFAREEYQSFWMRNTEISLDIIFVNSKEEIVTIHENTNTFSDESYPSTKPAIFVVEVAAGFAGKHGIRVGDKIVWRRTK